MMRTKTKMVCQKLCIFCQCFEPYANILSAENHYTADYPDEEVDSDDEFDRNAYNYRNHNASDLEEFDEDDATFSDDDSEATKYPWMNKPWLKKSTGTFMDDSD